MAFRVEITPRAREDLDRIYTKVIAEAPLQGARWFSRLEQAVLSLSDGPERFPVEPKLSSSKRVVRKLLFGKRRYVFRIYLALFDDVVRILHIRHGARRDLHRL